MKLLIGKLIALSWILASIPVLILVAICFGKTYQDAINLVGECVCGVCDAER